MICNTYKMSNEQLTDSVGSVLPSFLATRFRAELQKMRDNNAQPIVMCWTCGDKPGTHTEWRDALGMNEHTCDACHQEEYPEQYDVQ